MYVLNCNQPTYFDVDGTIVYWGYANVPTENTVPVECKGFVQHLIPHKKHIEQIKAHKARGHPIIVWSAGGHLWAESVVKSLKLEEFVYLIIEKPQWAYDDLIPQEYMPKSSFLKDDNEKK